MMITNFLYQFYHKPTYTLGLLTNYFSFIPNSYKISLIRTLVDRTFKINNTWNYFDKDLTKLSATFCKNMFPPKLIDMIIKSDIHGKYEKTNTTTSDNSNDKRYFKLPYIGKFSTLTKNKIKCLVEKYCKDIDVSLVFTSYKIKDSFSTKDYVPKALKSGIIYQFVCASCKACYVG